MQDEATLIQGTLSNVDVNSDFIQNKEIYRLYLLDCKYNSDGSI